jgi:hypothetical protein
VRDIFSKNQGNTSMHYTLFDRNGQRIFLRDLQNKGPWCEHGYRTEEIFVSTYGPALDLVINPEKQKSAYVPDLYNVKTRSLAELKTQNTPFFEARKRYAIDPQYAVVFNIKDRQRYKRHYPRLDIYFWVDWQAIRLRSNRSDISVSPMSGVWKIAFEVLDMMLDSAPVHEYRSRRNDTKGNARASYVVPLLRDEFVKVI